MAPLRPPRPPRPYSPSSPNRGMTADGLGSGHRSSGSPRLVLQSLLGGGGAGGCCSRVSSPCSRRRNAMPLVGSAAAAGAGAGRAWLWSGTGRGRGMRECETVKGTPAEDAAWRGEDRRETGSLTAPRCTDTSTSMGMDECRPTAGGSGARGRGVGCAMFRRATSQTPPKLRSSLGEWSSMRRGGGQRLPDGGGTLARDQLGLGNLFTEDEHLVSLRDHLLIRPAPWCRRRGPGALVGAFSPRYLPLLHIAEGRRPAGPHPFSLGCQRRRHLERRWQSQRLVRNMRARRGAAGGLGPCLGREPDRRQRRARAPRMHAAWRLRSHERRREPQRRQPWRLQTLLAAPPGGDVDHWKAGPLPNRRRRTRPKTSQLGQRDVPEHHAALTFPSRRWTVFPCPSVELTASPLFPRDPPGKFHQDH
eukprot:scaffold21821_cov90-Isochrysis_galbana.AAC.2